MSSRNNNKHCSCHRRRSHKCCCHKEKPNHCQNRNFRDCAGKLANLLSTIKKEEFGKPIEPTLENREEAKYKNYNYNGSFHKTLTHNKVDGRLINPEEYERMTKAIVEGNQPLLESVILAKDSSMKMVNPLASLSTLLVGAMQGVLKLRSAPTLSSDTGAAEMVELYAHAIARDVPFIEYNNNATINQLLGVDFLNNPSVLEHLKYSPASVSNPFTAQTIFRSDLVGDTFGPYVSQFLLLSVIAGAMSMKQLWIVPPTRAEAQSQGFRVEWGVNLEETINLQNGNLSLLPPPTPKAKMVERYIYSGRSLAEVVHNDPIYQFFINAALILQSLGAQVNTAWPSYINQSYFITNSGLGALQGILGDVAVTALKHSWYWKWQHSRKLRPETFGLWVHDVKTGLVDNKDNFDISNLLLDNPILGQILTLNESWIPGSTSYTLPQAYREGAPAHPAYISGHSIISGACCTILKMFYTSDQKWITIPGVISGALSGIPNSVVEAKSDGTSLLAYSGDISDMTVATEINKLASNVGIGRNWAGIHYRSDAIAAIKLGEKVAIHYMQDILSTMVENNSNGSALTIAFRKFDGTMQVVGPTLCLPNH